MRPDQPVVATSRIHSAEPTTFGLSSDGRTDFSHITGHHTCSYVQTLARRPQPPWPLARGTPGTRTKREGAELSLGMSCSKIGGRMGKLAKSKKAAAILTSSRIRISTPSFLDVMPQGYTMQQACLRRSAEGASVRRAAPRAAPQSTGVPGPVLHLG